MGGSPILLPKEDVTDEMTKAYDQAVRKMKEVWYEEMNNKDAPYYFFSGNYESIQSGWFDKLNSETCRISLRTDLGWIVAEVFYP